MDAEGAPQPAGLDRGVEQSEVGGMEHAVAEPSHHRDGREARERMRGRDQRQRNADDAEPARQDVPRAEAVDGEARRGLRDTGDAVEHAAQDADVGEGESGLVAHDQKHRDESELVVVTDAVSNADQGDHSDVAPDR